MRYLSYSILFPIALSIPIYIWASYTWKPFQRMDGFESVALIAIVISALLVAVVIGLFFAFAWKLNRIVGLVLTCCYIASCMILSAYIVTTEAIIPNCQNKVMNKVIRTSNTSLLKKWCINDKVLPKALNMAEKHHNQKVFEAILAQGVSHNNIDCARLKIHVANNNLREIQKIISKGTSAQCISNNSSPLQVFRTKNKGKFSTQEQIYNALSKSFVRPPKFKGNEEPDEIQLLTGIDGAVTHETLRRAINNKNYTGLAEFLKYIDPNFESKKIMSHDTVQHIKNPLALAIFYNDVDAVKILLDAGAKFSQTVSISKLGNNSNNTVKKYDMLNYAKNRRIKYEEDIQRKLKKREYTNHLKTSKKNLEKIISLLESAVNNFTPEDYFFNKDTKLRLTQTFNLENKNVDKDFFKNTNRFKSKYYKHNKHCKKAINSHQHEKLVLDIMASLKMSENQNELTKVLNCAVLIRNNKKIESLIYSLANTLYANKAAGYIIKLFNQSNIKSSDGIEAILILTEKSSENSSYYFSLIDSLIFTGEKAIDKLLEMSAKSKKISTQKRVLKSLMTLDINHPKVIEVMRDNLDKENNRETVLHYLNKSEMITHSMNRLVVNMINVTDNTINALEPELKNLEEQSNFKAFELLRRHGIYPTPKGYITRKSISEEAARIKIYNQPSGKIIGEITFNPLTGSIRDRTSKPVVEAIINGKPISIRHELYLTGQYLNDDAFLLYYKKEKNYAQILSSTKERPAWIPIDSDQFVLFTWAESIVQAGTELLYGYDHMLLKREASKESETILVLDERKHYLKNFTGEINNAWAEVEVLEFNEKPEGCVDISKYKFNKFMKGWIKVTDDRGLKNSSIKRYINC